MSERRTAPALAAYYAQRQIAHQPFRAACYAPFASMYLDTLGFVRACCQNWTGMLGNIAHERLLRIWRGPRAGRLREAMRADDLSQGCQYCQWQISEGPPESVFANQFDQFTAASDGEFWPAQIEFSVTNRCNLQCAMCNGEWSHLIRARRENLPPLPELYGDDFFDDLRKFLPHARYLKFMGGEPLLANETFRVWDLLDEANLEVACHVTTNGTQFNARIERAMQRQPISFAVSIDGVTAATVERIRHGARFDEIMGNFRRFHTYVRQRGTKITLTFCLMPHNWHEFGRYLLLGDEYDCDVVVNTVLYPPAHSLYHLPPAELQKIVDALDAEGASLESQLRRNHFNWVRERERLRQRAVATPESWIALIPRRQFDQFPADAPPNLPELPAAAAKLPAIEFDDDDRVIGVHPHDRFAEIESTTLLGRPLEQVYALLRTRWGGVMHLQATQADGPDLLQIWSFTDTALRSTRMTLRVSPRRNAQGSLRGTRLELVSLVDSATA